MTPPAYSLALRFWLGAAGSIAAGLIVFRSEVFLPGSPKFHCVTVGVLAAAILTLVRSARPCHAALLASAFGLVHLGLVRQSGWAVALVAGLAGLLLGLGLILISVIFDLLARSGYRFGKFFIFGPLLGGLYVAVTPIGEFHSLTSGGALRTLFLHVFLGLLIGNGVGFGVELAELIAEPGSSKVRPRRADRPELNDGA